MKRMLAYSSINHAGFILVAVQAASRRRRRRARSSTWPPTRSWSAAPSASSPSSAGGATATTPSTTTAGCRGASRCSRFAFTVFLLAQAGVPLTSGFLAKFYVIDAAVEARSYWLALVAMLSAVISAFLYLRIVLTMYGGPGRGARTPRPSADGQARPGSGCRSPPAVALVVAVVATIGIGLVPDPLTETARNATPELVATPAD